MKKELELMKKQQSEKEKGVVKELRELLHQKVQECEEQFLERQKFEAEAEKLKGQLA